MVLRKLKRLLGLGTSEDSGRSERDVTVQGGEADAETEAAVKGADTEEEEAEPVASGTDADASTESLVDEEMAQEEPSGRAEPAEAAGPDAEDESTDVDATEPAAAAAETDDADEADGDSPSVEEVKGIGPAYSERLEEIGVETVADLRDADAAEIAEQTTAPEGTVQKWIDRANDWD